MEEVTLAIKLPKDTYDAIVNKYDTFSAEMKEWGLEAIKNGTVISESNGDPKDTDAVSNEFNLITNRSVKNQFHTIKQACALVSVDKENLDAYND